MKVINTWTQRNWVEDANSWLSRKTLRYQPERIYLAAGETMRKLHESWHEAPFLISDLTRIQVDDVVTGPKVRLFANYFAEVMPNLPVLAPAFDMFANLAILGLGMNGHVAFHEPGMPTDFRYRMSIELSPETCATLNLAPGTRGWTFGIGAFMSTDAVLLIVLGEKKRAILERVLAGDESLPATALLKHPDFTILTDIHGLTSTAHIM